MTQTTVGGAGDPARLIRVQIVADSVTTDPDGVPRRLRSYRLTYPRIVLVDINTHRALSKSTESSRAIRPGRRLAQLRARPYVPFAWSAAAPGMGRGEPLPPGQAKTAAAAWEYALAAALEAGQMLHDASLAKEELNRISEPFALCRTILTGTEWDNFFALRTGPEAHPVFGYLARAMYLAGLDSEPVAIDRGGWHAPFVSGSDYEAALRYCSGRPTGADTLPLAVGSPLRGSVSWPQYHLLRWSAARCARVSFGRVEEGNATPEADDKTWAKLVGDPDPVRAAWGGTGAVGGSGAWPYRPLHASPLEHQGTPARNPGPAGLSGNFTGWYQFRKLFRNECARAFEPPPDVVAGWRAEIAPEVFGSDDLY